MISRLIHLFLFLNNKALAAPNKIDNGWPRQ